LKKAQKSTNHQGCDQKNPNALRKTRESFDWLGSPFPFNLGQGKVGKRIPDFSNEFCARDFMSHVRAFPYVNHGQYLIAPSHQILKSVLSFFRSG
jgi:hypothetical protein